MSLYRPKGSNVYVMDFMLHGQRIRETTGMTSITRARKVEDKRKQALRDGAAGIRKAGSPRLLSVAAVEWQETKQAAWSPKMGEIAANSMGHLLPVLGKKLLVDIDASDVARYQKTRLAENASPRSVNIEVAMLRQIMRKSGMWERIRPDVVMLKERDDVGRALTQEEEIVLLHESGGSRQRAVETLRFWSQQFPARQPRHYVFPLEKCRCGGNEETFGFTGEVLYETDPSQPIGDVKEAWEGAKKRTRRHCPSFKTGRLVERAERGEGYVCEGWRTETDVLPVGLTSVRFHDLRHTAVSRMIAAGIPLPIIAKIVGWSAGTMAKMAARYGHFQMEGLRGAVETISSPKIDAGSPRFSPQSEARVEGASVN